VSTPKKRDSKRQRSKRKGLVRESKWVRIYAAKPNVWIQTAKFLENGLGLTADEFEKMWAGLPLQEKLDLCAAYSAKPTISAEDERVLNIVMEKGDDVTWNNIVSTLTRHGDKERVTAFVRTRIEKQSPPLANFYQAVETLGDAQAIHQLQEKYQSYLDSGVTPETKDRVSGIDYLTCCRTLWKLTGSSEYKRSIDRFLTASDDVLKQCAARLVSH
jgi:hypothetical protein